MSLGLQFTFHYARASDYSKFGKKFYNSPYLFALWWSWLLEVGVLAKMLVIQLLDVGHVGGLWHDALLIQHGDKTERLE